LPDATSFRTTSVAHYEINVLVNLLTNLTPFILTRVGEVGLMASNSSIAS